MLESTSVLFWLPSGLFSLCALFLLGDGANKTCISTKKHQWKSPEGKDTLILPLSCSLPLLNKHPCFASLLLCTRLTASKIFPQQYPKPRSSRAFWMAFSSAHTYSPSWLLSFPSYCTIRMTRWDLLHRRRILNNPERRWHSQLWMGPVQTPLSCWKDKLRSDWCGGFQQGMIKNKKKTGGGEIFWKKNFSILRREGKLFWGSIKTPKPVLKQSMEWEKPSEAGKATQV